MSRIRRFRNTEGARPADLPIQRPAVFKLAVNMRTAKALGVTIPPLLLQRADQVIE
jgi:putative ABC transport system substrate-binding protein